MTEIYAFKYNYCIHESVCAVISLHESKNGAKEAMNAHKKERKAIWDDYDKWQREEFGKDYKRMKSSRFGKFERWSVEKMELLP